MQDLDEKLIREAIEHLNDILERYAFAFVHLDRGGLIARIERIRESALAAKLILEERRSLRLEP
jgi:hypothetical protein